MRLAGAAGEAAGLLIDSAATRGEMEEPFDAVSLPSLQPIFDDDAAGQRVQQDDAAVDDRVGQPLVAVVQRLDQVEGAPEGAARDRRPIDPRQLERARRNRVDLETVDPHRVGAAVERNRSRSARSAV
jgi:hypothetical protein